MGAYYILLLHNQKEHLYYNKIWWMRTYSNQLVEDKEDVEEGEGDHGGAERHQLHVETSQRG